MLFTNDYGETIKVRFTEHDLLTTDTKAYREINRIINPLDMNITTNNPYNDEEKNKCCFLELKTEYENILVVFKTEENPCNFLSYFELFVSLDGEYPDLFGDGTLRIALINKENQLVLMYGTSIIILDINTFEVIKYTTSKSINGYGIKITYDNNMHIVEDDEHKITKFDENLNIIN